MSINLLLFLLVAAVVAATATIEFDTELKVVKHKLKLKKVHCKDKSFAHCYHKQLHCPASCPRDCVVDCKNCRPVCKAVLPKFPPPTASILGGRKPRIVVMPSAEVVRCNDTRYPGCYYKEFTCPASCPRTCEVDCVSCGPVCSCDRPGAVCQDPRFIGGDGLKFFFHGKKDRDFCLVTDSNLHINAHFIGKRNENMTRDFTWVQAVAILFNDHQVYVGAKKTVFWNEEINRLEITYDGEAVHLPELPGASWTSSDVVITRVHNTNDIVIEAQGNFKIKAAVVPITRKDSIVHKYGITDEDCFAHLDLSFKFYSLTGNVNGVLGQTYATNYVSRIKKGVQMPVLGGNKEFSTSGLFEPDCEVARYVGSNNVVSERSEFDDLHCGTSGDGHGVLCKR
ncbi:hypothetical protein Droror1_Dr00003164 [Drosera rotundifolia]